MDDSLEEADPRMGVDGKEGEMPSTAVSHGDIRLWWRRVQKMILARLLSSFSPDSADFGTNL